MIEALFRIALSFGAVIAGAMIGAFSFGYIASRVSSGDQTATGFAGAIGLILGVMIAVALGERFQ